MPSLSKLLAIVVRALALGLTMLAGHAALAEEQPPSVMIVLDSSLGMAARLDGSRKSILTRKALPAALAAQTRAMNAGLIAFGHRKRKDCANVDMLSPLGPLDAKHLARSIGSVRPRGQAPLTEAIRMGAAALGEAPGPRSLLVVAGGTDSCGQDACALAREIAGAAVRTTIHVLGVAMADESIAGAQCIAEATGGRFVNAATGAEIDAAAAELLALVARSAGEPATALDSNAPELRLSASLGPDTAPIAETVAWRVSKGDEIVFEGSAPTARIPLPAGQYRVVASLGSVSASTDVTVGESGVSAAVVNLDAAVLTIRTLSGPQLAPLAGSAYTLYRTDGDPAEPEVVAVSRDLTPRFVLRPGSYRILVEQGLNRIERTLTLQAGREVTETIELLTGTLMLEARATPNGPPLETVFFFLTEDDPASPGGMREVARSAASQPVFTLPAGTYHVLARQGRAEARLDVGLRNGEAVRQVVLMGTAMLGIEGRSPVGADGFDAAWTFVVTGIDPLAGAESEVTRTTRPNPRLALPAGKYRITGRLGTVNATVSQEVTLRAGQDQVLAFEPRAGFVELTLAESEDGLAGRDIFWEVKDSNGNRVLNTTVARPRVILAPGDYRVTARQQRKELVTAFTLVAGERKSVSLAPE